jgi:hypothetical protein
MVVSATSFAIYSIVALALLCPQNARCENKFLSVDGKIEWSSGSNAPRSSLQVSSAPCDVPVDRNANGLGASARPCILNQTANMSFHLSYWRRQVSRENKFSGSGNQRRRLNALADYVYMQDTPEADALAGDALDASVGGDLYALGANEVKRSASAFRCYSQSSSLLCYNFYSICFCTTLG